MTTAQLVSLPSAQGSPLVEGDAIETARSFGVEGPAAEELLDEVLPAADVVVAAGPPVMFLAAFGALVTLMVCPPLMIMLTIVAIGLVAVAVVVVVCGAVLLGPYLLVHLLTSRRPR